jgi:flagellar secretion chaperone FliS
MSNGYSQAYRSAQITGMAPERLTLALFEGALMRLDRAQEAIVAGDVAGRGQAIGKAMAIICELQGTLDMEKGGEIAVRLFQLYSYMIRELLQANLHADSKALANARAPLQEIRDGWAEMLTTLTPQIAQAANGGPIKAYF